MSTHTINLNEHLYHYFQNISLREHETLKKLRNTTQAMPGIHVMQISPEQGQFMGLLAELMQAKRTLDIGTFTGYSALAVALSLPTDGKVISCDLNQTWTNVAQQFWKEAGVFEKIELKLAPAADTLKNLIETGHAGSFDFAFIDADKINYDNYYELSLSLLKKNGLIAIDNVLWSGKVADPAINDKETNAIRQLNKKILADDRVNLSLIPIGDGLTLVRKK